MGKVRVGLIGLGFMGSTHWRIYEALPGVKVTALADVDAAKRSGDVSKVVGNIGGGDNSKPLDMTGVAVYDDALKMIAEADVDMGLALEKRFRRRASSGDRHPRFFPKGAAGT